MYKNCYPGKFIVFEGLDGSGQSTQVNLLGQFLKSKGIDVVLTKEPTNLPIGKFIRSVLNKKFEVSLDALQLLFSADRTDHLAKVVIPALRNGRWVISDRYFFSTFAYGFLNLSLDWLIGINDIFLLPDLVFLLKVSPQVCLERIDLRGKRQFFEEPEKLTKAWQGYEKSIEGFKNIKMINGERPIERVFEDIKGEIEKYFHV